MRDQHLNPDHWRQRFPIDHARFQLNFGEWIAEMERDPATQPNFVGFDIVFSLIGHEALKKRMQLVVPMMDLTGEPDKNLNMFRHEIEEFLNSDQDFLSLWHQG